MAGHGAGGGGESSDGADGWGSSLDAERAWSGGAGEGAWERAHDGRRDHFERVVRRWWRVGYTVVSIRGRASSMSDDACTMIFGSGLAGWRTAAIGQGMCITQQGMGCGGKLVKSRDRR